MSLNEVIDADRFALIRRGSSVQLIGELDVEAGRALRAVVRPLGALVRLDLEAVTYMDSPGLVALLRLQQELVGAGGRLELAEPSPAVERVLEVTRTTERFAIARRARRPARVSAPAA